MTAPIPTSPFPRTPTETFPYSIEREAGAGAMGVVYRALDPTLARPVAIKVLQPRGKEDKIDEEMRRRFLQEARAAAALSHPAVTTVHQIGEIDGVPYIVMEWLEGTTLEVLMQREKRLSLDRAAELIGELLAVLGVAHAGGVVHRDLKPSNLILLDNGRLKVTDFGIALLQGRQLVETVAGTVLATPQFASPEQLEGREVDGRADLFAAGELFYHLVTGDMPFEGRNLVELITAVLHKPPVPLADRWPNVPPPVEAWCMKALAKRREDRFDSAEQMAEALRRWATPVSERQTVETRWTTRMMAAPANLEVSGGSLPERAMVDLMRSWPARDLGRLEASAFLTKLLETPIHADAFAGLATFGDYSLLVSGGVVHAVVPPGDLCAQVDASLPQEATARVHPLPDGYSPKAVELLSAALHPANARHQGLDTRVVNLSAFAGKLLEEGFAGLMSLRDGDRWAFVFLSQGRSELALISEGWERDPRQTEWSEWLNSVAATAAFLDSVTQPPALWFRQGFSEVNLDVDATIPRKPRSGSGSMSLTSVLPAAGSEAVFTLRPRLEDLRHGDLSLADSSTGRLVSWLFGELPQTLVDRRQVAGWKYLGDWLLLVKRLRIHTVLGDGDDASPFDVVSEDADGKILHVAQRIPQLDTETFQAFVDEVVAIKESRIKRGDIGGVVLVTPRLTDEVREAYKTLVSGGWGNKLFGFDKSMGYEGFVRLSARRGFHLLLVEHTADGLFPHFKS
ncbi:MAG: serine/threonine-protein kinase [Acidobacteriota bacterium]